jgi:colicin import membrane protein
MNASLYGNAMRPPPAPGIGRGLSLALLVHAALVIAIAFSVQWRTRTPPAYEAELWGVVPTPAAPAEVLPPPAPEPRPEKPLPAPAPVSTVDRSAEIAIEKAREEEKRKAADAAREARLAKEKLERERDAERKKQAAEKARLEKVEKAKQEKLEQQEALKREREQAAQREALRKENLKRIQGLAGASGGPSATGTALQSTGPSANYAGRIKARIRPNIVFGDTVAGNPLAEVEVRVGPDGSILSRRLTKPSGNAEWDRAVLRAIDKTEILPRDVDGRVQPVMLISFQPQE